MMFRNVKSISGT